VSPALFSIIQNIHKLCVMNRILLQYWLMAIGTHWFPEIIRGVESFQLQHQQVVGTSLRSLCALSAVKKQHPQRRTSTSPSADHDVLRSCMTNNRPSYTDRNRSSSSSDDATSSRRLFFATALFTAGATLTPTLPLNKNDNNAAAAYAASNLAAFQSTGRLPWETSPINKRSGITTFDAEKAGYTVAFVTYLARFLLNFDPDCQQWWFSTKLNGVATTAEQVEQLRLDQFAAFAASVEVGLQEYEGKDGPQQLLESLLRKYGRVVVNTSDNTNAPPADDASSTAEASTRQRRLVRAARRQIALLFGLLTERQPVEELTKLLASVDNGSITAVQLLLNDETAATAMGGFESDGTASSEPPVIEFPPPQAGDEEGFERAEGRAVLQPTGRLLRLEIVDPGSGYTVPPTITVTSTSSSSSLSSSSSSPPSSSEGDNVVADATAKAKISTRGDAKGGLVSVELTNAGAGYFDEGAIRVEVSPPPDGVDGQTAVVKPILDMAIASIEVTKGGSGYAVEKPLKVYLKTTSGKGEKRIQIGTSYPKAEKTSFTSFRTDSDKKTIRDLEEKVYNLQPSAVSGSVDGGGTTLPFWTGKSSSAELLRLLPAGVGLEYDTKLKRYALAIDSNYVSQFPNALLKSSNRPIGPEFGPRGRAPIERDMELGVSTYLRFCASGAICASAVHLALTPIDVVKTKVQTNPVAYPSIGASFATIYKEEGLPTFFTGWLPTFLSNFAGGGVLYALVEYLRRGLSEAAGVDAVRLEVPIILCSAAVAAAVAAVLNCPFEAIRIRTVAQPDYAPNSVEVFKKIVTEEGVGSLFDAVPPFLIRYVRELT